MCLLKKKPESEAAVTGTFSSVRRVFASSTFTNTISFREIISGGNETFLLELTQVKGFNFNLTSLDDTVSMI